MEGGFIIKLYIDHTEIKTSELETLVEGNIGSIFVGFSFSEEWNGLARIAVFRNGETKVSVSVESNRCAIPWEVLSAPGKVFVSVRGIGDGGELIVCTENALLGAVSESDANAVAQTAAEPTPDIFEALLADVAELRYESNAIWLPEIDSSGNLSWSKSDSDTAPSEMNIKGEQGERGLQGEKGDTGAQGPKGDKGDKGDQGDKGDTGERGLQGIQGTAGQDGHTPVRGTDYWTAADKAEIVNAALDELPEVPTALAELEEDSTHRTVTDSEKSAWDAKQDAIDASHKLPYAYLSGAPSIPTVPTNVSAFTNDAGYLTQHQSLAAYRTSAAQDAIDSGKLTEPSSGLAVGKYFRIASIDADGHAVLEAVEEFDVQLNGESVVQDGVANIPIADNSHFGVIKCETGGAIWRGLTIVGGYLNFEPVNATLLADRVRQSAAGRIRAITMSTLDLSVKTALTDGIEAEWTTLEKQGALARLGITVDEQGICHFNG